jgi:glycosyltransferase involved in cell wall biosynthesis
VIHNGIVHIDRASQSQLRAELGLGSGSVIVGAVGNLRPAKDYPNLLAAAKIALQERSDLRFVVAGSGSKEALDELLELRSQLGLEDAVHFLGFRDDIRAITSGFDIFVSSSSSEGLPLATLEAMGMGLPAVLGGPSEIVTSGETGVLVPPRDPGALARGIVEMAADRERARRIGERGRDDVRRRFSADTMVAEYVSLYGEVLGR